MSGNTGPGQIPPCWLCGAADGRLVVEVRARPEREIDFGIEPDRYYRAIYRCGRCAVFYSAHDLLDDDVYTGRYNESIYEHQLAERYDRIMSLPHDRSDNRQRVVRVTSFVGALGWTPKRTRVLDVGTGLCVFLGGMKEQGFRCYCIDPDPIATRHALEHVGVDGAYTGTLDGFKTAEPFEVISFNKVLEHVKDPADQLRRAVELLADNGVIYIELPDGQTALEHGTPTEREEFFIDHYTVYCPASLSHLVEAAGLTIAEARAIHEPSDKYTLYAFCHR
ncbi:MAG: class I SAM-dependent methyltransferase [Phycisphaerae bacterium]|nr:class I SAM-dependent methyltransferase [Phycisphaerae bacterium]